MEPLVIVTGKHSGESIRRFSSLPGCRVVMDPEPLPEDHPLWTTPRVYITPHVSGGYRAGVNYDRVIDTAVWNLPLVLQGKPPIHTVDRRLGY